MTADYKQRRDTESVPSERLAFCSHYSASSTVTYVFVHKPSHTQTTYTQLPKLLTFILMEQDNLRRFQIFTVSFPASHVFKNVHRGTAVYG